MDSPAESPILRAAGILFISGWRILMMRRVAHKTSDDGDPSSFPNTWAFPGGGIEDGETAEEAARRECQEETGFAYDGPLILWTRRIANGVDFTTFLARVDEFTPTLNDEHDAYCWCDKDLALGAPKLHPGVNIALSRFDMDELGVAKAIAAGELTSPQYYGKDLMLVALRITGTGGSFRPAIDEYVWRDPSLYMNDEFLQRCSGLSVIFRHPGKTLLNTEEFRKRIVGSIFVPYFRPDMPDGPEVWGIARIQDMEAASLLANYQMSTSPAVLCLGDKLETSDGKHLLIEDKPKLLDHLAILIPETETDPETGDMTVTDTGQGVWDRGKGLAGVESVDALPLEETSPLDTILSAIMNQQVDQFVNRL